MDEGTQGNGPCVDHGIDVGSCEGLVAVIEGVEGLARGFHAYQSADTVDAAVQKRLQENEGFGYGLHGELLCAVPCEVVSAVLRGNVDPDLVGIDYCQFGDIGCNMTLRGIVGAVGHDLFQ